MAVLWMVAAIYLTSLNGTDFLKDSGGPANKSDQIYVRASTDSGPVKGVADFSTSPALIRFFGIPYAKPPTGSLRFKKPEAATPWTDERDATQFGHECIQNNIFYDNPTYRPSEDCLYLNVYSPTRNVSDRNLPVMVWIHGGAFIFGSSSEYDGSDLARRGVVVVTINYRLDLFGFLSTEDDVLPGNYGMLDQVLALQWVQKNIAAFGGDPKQVTIFGESAGAISVSHLILSPLGKDLFQRAIIQSGSSIMREGTVHSATRMSPRYIAKIIGSSVGCTLNDSAQYLTCLQGVDSEILTKESINLAIAMKPVFFLLPRVERTFGFLPDSPINLWRTGQYSHVDTIRGFNTHELLSLKANPDEAATRKEFAEEILEFLRAFAIPDYDEFVKRCEDIYLGNISDPLLILQKISSAATDLAFVAPTITEIKLAEKSALRENQYLYQFDYRPSFSIDPDWVTATHYSEIPFLFGLNSLPIRPSDLTLTPDDERVSDVLLSLWTNFAKTGNPTQNVTNVTKWEPFTDNRPQLLKIGLKSAMTIYDKPDVLKLYEDFLRDIDPYQNVSTMCPSGESSNQAFLKFYIFLLICFHVAFRNFQNPQF